MRGPKIRFIGLIGAGVGIGVVLGALILGFTFTGTAGLLALIYDLIAFSPDPIGPSVVKLLGGWFIISAFFLLIIKKKYSEQVVSCLILPAGIISNQPPSATNLVSLNPNFITGFTDAEGSFLVCIVEKNNRIGW
jgi:hypothetical protein